MSTADFSSLKFGPDGLIPAIVQDGDSGEVLMMAFMNRESLQMSLQTRRTWFYSRSRHRLWQKGETSGHCQEIRQILHDCDHDTLLIKVTQTGEACHEGFRTCFHYPLAGPEGADDSQATAAIGERLSDPKQVYRGIGPVLEELYGVVAGRKEERPQGSYTTYLFDKGLDKILKKVGEESSEVIIASKNSSRDELIYETADLFYHLMVLLVEQGISLNDVAQELIKRRK